jgi:hypothetical protein
MTIDLTALRRTMPWSPDDLPPWEANEDHAFDPFFTYVDRETCLAWAAEWKADYVELSAEIRRLKRERPALQRAGAYDSAAVAPLVEARKSARAMLALRRGSKRHSWAKRSAAKVA